MWWSPEWQWSNRYILLAGQQPQVEWWDIWYLVQPWLRWLGHDCYRFFSLIDCQWPISTWAFVDTASPRLSRIPLIFVTVIQLSPWRTIATYFFYYAGQLIWFFWTFYCLILLMRDWYALNSLFSMLSTNFFLFLALTSLLFVTFCLSRILEYFHFMLILFLLIT